ncbi:MAG: hypothetical protein ACI8YQ_001073 [Polaribacter sp.]
MGTRVVAEKERWCEQVDYYLHENNTTEAIQQLNNMPANFQMTQNQLLEYNYFSIFKNIQISLGTQGKCIADLDLTEIEDIKSIAYNSQGVAGQQAKNILNHSFGFDIFDPTIFPSFSAARLNENEGKVEEGNRVIAFPNPATDKLTFEYHLDRSYSNLVIKVYNSNGKHLSNIETSNDKDGFVSWDANSLLPGIYYYSICSNDHPLNTGKLVIVK